jgi:iron-sulfur cluster protein
MAEVDFEALREDVRELKERSISRLPELVTRFKSEAEKVGVVVHEARNAAQARLIVEQIAAERGAKLIVKSKSMLTEEIELNAHLEKSGMRVVETDLGEWIIQLAGDKPSHFTQPATHMTKEQVAALFSKKLGREIPADIPSLVETARVELRQAFVDADMGISGANIAIAETGSIVVIANEGNDRLVTTLPPVHVAVVGYEKLVETFDDAAKILKLLAKSGTGQKLTAYTSFITGPSRTTDIEKALAIGVHGPREVHVVLVDNGRLAMSSDDELAEAAYCIKCGACLNVCPVYRTIGGHVYGNSYMGGIGALLTAFHRSLDASEETLALCAGCRRCESVCPAKIDTPSMTNALRRRLVEQNGLGVVGKLLLRGVLRNPDVLRKGVGLLRTLQKPVARCGRIAWAPFVPGFRTNPAVADRTLHDILPERTEAVGSRKARVTLYAGCVADFIYPEIGESAAQVMSNYGAEVLFPHAQACCGAPALYSGDFETARELATRNIDVLLQDDPDAIVTVCPTCAVVLKEEFPQLLAGTDFEEKAALLASKVRDFSEFAATTLQIEAAGRSVKATYHDPCHQVRGIGGGECSREVLGRSGVDLVEMPESDICCGCAGSYAMKYPDISASILERKIANIESVEPEVVVTDCPGCIMQIRGGLEKRGQKIRVCHTAELINSSRI